MLRTKQTEINQAASGIDVNLVKRKDTLLKLLEQTKAYMKFEKVLLKTLPNYVHYQMEQLM